MTRAEDTEIPVIDFAPFLANDPAGQRRVVEAMDYACRQVGFLYLTHHGIPQAAIDIAFQQAQRFFALPLTEKMAIAWASEQSNRGYVGLERERLDETQPGDLKEAFNIGKEPAEGDSAPTGNRWPQGQVDFRPTMTSFLTTVPLPPSGFFGPLPWRCKCQRTTWWCATRAKTSPCVCCTIRPWSKPQNRVKSGLGRIPTMAPSPCCFRMRWAGWRCSTATATGWRPRLSLVRC